MFTTQFIDGKLAEELNKFQAKNRNAQLFSVVSLNHNPGESEKYQAIWKVDPATHHGATP